MFLVNSPTSLSYMDFVNREVLDARGRIVELIEVHGKDGQVEAKFHLTRTKDARAAYVLDGNSDGKPLSAKLFPKNPDGLWGPNLADSEVSTKLLTGQAKELQYEVFDAYHPYALYTDVATVESLKDRTVRYKTAVGEQVDTFNAAGESTRSEASVRGAQLVVERVYPEARQYSNGTVPP
jgi:hypothetical protein